MRRCCGFRRKSEVQRTQKRGIRREGPRGGLNLDVGRGKRPECRSEIEILEELRETVFISRVE